MTKGAWMGFLPSIERFKVIYIRLADSICLLVEVFLSGMIPVEVSGKMQKIMDKQKKYFLM